MNLDFHDEALEFVRDHKFSMTVQDVEKAMKIGASKAIQFAAERIEKTRIEMEDYRRINNHQK